MKHNHISRRNVLSLRGQDRISFLQGLVTADLITLSPGEMVFSALLSPQGKIRYLFYIFCTDDALYLDCAEDQGPALLKQLGLFKLRADIELMTSTLNVYAGPPGTSLCEETLVTATDRTSPMTGWRALSSLPPVTSGDGDNKWLERRLKAGIPEICDISLDKTIALEANLDCLGAISWTKGCYMGQEVTARSHYRTLIKRRLVPVSLQDGIFPETGGEITASDQSSFPLLSRRGNRALIMLPRTLWNNSDLKYAGKVVSVDIPEQFTEIFSSQESLP
ncbi:folate-binding protein [Acetobacteraceae bacterium ESL0709]|nr:folate-binding protein [Acetobacteraceae bacterium ESL0697]MDF7678209.1 folate-binding protein [Acetobacteraceae bacterium ESL0709]